MRVHRKNPVKPHFYFGREGVNIILHNLRLRRISTWLARKETFLESIHAFIRIGRFYFILMFPSLLQQELCILSGFTAFTDLLHG